MAIGALRVPIRIADSYVATDDVQRLFPNCPSFLSREEILEVWPGGLITHQKFHHNGLLWRLVKRPMSDGSSVYMAILDDSRASSNGTASANGVIDDHRLHGFHSHDISDVVSGCDIVPAYVRGPHHAPSAPILGHASSQSRLQLASSSMRDRNGLYSSAMLATPQPSGQLSADFMNLLLSATESPRPLDRYKAFVPLISLLNRRREELGLPQLAPRAPASATSDPGWDSPEAQELVRQTLMVGERLANFGTAAELLEGRNNSSRAITTKDYEKLLRMFLERQGAVFRDDFLQRLPLGLQDDALTVRSLLETRCETVGMLFNQLVKHVGQEQTAGGGAVVYNNSTVSASPKNYMLSAPKTLVNTVSNAWSKADVKRRTQMGAVGAVAVVALWVLKRKLFGGGGGRSRRSRRDDDTTEHGGGSSRWSRRLRGSSDLASRLLEERQFAERMGARYVDACQEELHRAQRNIELLKSDWRLGPLRLALTGPVPPGYEELQTNHCSVASYMNALDGGVPFTLPYNANVRQYRSSGGGLSIPMREAPPLTGPAATAAAE